MSAVETGRIGFPSPLAVRARKFRLLLLLMAVGVFAYCLGAILGAPAGLAWGAGAGVTILAASTITLGLDRRVFVVGRTRIPEHPAGSRGLPLAAVGALIVTVGVASYGLLEDTRVLTLVGLFASVAIGIAMALRARDSIQAAESAYGRIDRALADAERARDELADSNEDLTRLNAQIQAVHIAYADLLNLTDERTHGRVRELIEDTGGELAELLEGEMERERRR